MPLAIEGIYPALLTPFTKDEEVNEAALKQLVNRLIVAKVNGIFALGTNGEFHVLSREEKLNITKIVVEETQAVYQSWWAAVETAHARSLSFRKRWRSLVSMRCRL